MTIPESVAMGKVSNAPVAVKVVRTPLYINLPIIAERMEVCPSKSDAPDRRPCCAVIAGRRNQTLVVGSMSAALSTCLNDEMFCQSERCRAHAVD
jgi:hypothetical protein